MNFIHVLHKLKFYSLPSGTRSDTHEHIESNTIFLSHALLMESWDTHLLYHFANVYSTFIVISHRRADIAFAENSPDC